MSLEFMLQSGNGRWMVNKNCHIEIIHESIFLSDFTVVIIKLTPNSHKGNFDLCTKTEKKLIAKSHESKDDG